MDRTRDTESWGDMLRGIDKERKVLPWAASDFCRSTTMSLAERKLRERDVDLIANVYRDPSREGMHVIMKSDADLGLISRRSDVIKKKFDFISHQGPHRKIDADPAFATARANKGKSRDWHILSHLQHGDHTQVPIRYQEDDRLELQKRFAAPPPKGRDPGRDFNIVSGKFKESDDVKQEKIASDIRDSCDKKFWKTHSYDFIKVKSYDKSHQEQFERQSEAVTRNQGVAQAARLPHSSSHSEGRTYDILNHTVLDSEKLAHGPMHNDIRALNRMKRTQMDDGIHMTGDFNAMLSEEKSLKRITFKRWEGEHDRGYDMLNNSLLGDPDAPIYLPAATRLPSTWKLLEPNQDRLKMTSSIKSPNNFLGTHTGTGMNVHRAYTSYPSERETGDAGHDNNQDDSNQNSSRNRSRMAATDDSAAATVDMQRRGRERSIEHSKEYSSDIPHSSSSGRGDRGDDMFRASSLQLDADNANNLYTITGTGRMTKSMRALPSERRQTAIPPMSNNNNNNTISNNDSSNNGDTERGPATTQRQRTGRSIPSLQMGRLDAPVTYAPVMSVRTGGLSAMARQ